MSAMLISPLASASAVLDRMQQSARQPLGKLARSHGTSAYKEEA